MREKYSLLSVKILQFGIAAILIISPFYTPIYVWAVSNFRNFVLFRTSKEIALVLLLSAVAILVLSHSSIVKRLFNNWLFLVAAAYLAFIFIVGLFDLTTDRVSYKAVFQGWILDARLPGFFLMTLLASTLVAHRKIAAVPWRKIVMYPAVLVVAFGLLQMTVLPDDALTHIGYGQDIVRPYQLVDENPDFVRVQSTLPGPNPLGAYLLLIIAITTALILSRNERLSAKWWILVAGAFVLLFGTYSRSAQIGTLIALAALIVIGNRRLLRRPIVIVGAAALILLSSITLFIFRDNDFVQNTFFHSSERSPSEVSSNVQRTEAIKGGVKDVIENPVGGGVGSAGPASRRNLNGPAKISENYFIQLGQELGVVGLLLFLTILILVVRGLWKLREKPLAKGLLASLAGLIFVNMVSHAWTDDTLAYIWWGLAGIALAMPAVVSRE